MSYRPPVTWLAVTKTLTTMITTRLIPISPSSATTEELLVEITEQLCRPFCVNSMAYPTATVTFTASPVSVINGNAVFTVFANVTVTSADGKSCGCAHTQVFTETFDLAFNEGTTNVVTLTPGTEVRVAPAYVKCCKAGGVKLVTSLTAAIA